MTHRLLVVPTGHEVGVTSVGLGIVRALDRLGLRFAFCKPIATSPRKSDRSTALIRLTTGLNPPEPIAQDEAERLLGEGDDAMLMEKVVERIDSVSEGADVIVIEGLVPVPEVVYAARVNIAMAQALDAELVLVGAPSQPDPVKVADNIDIASRAYGEVQTGQMRCCILNKVHIRDDDVPPSTTRGIGPALGLSPVALNQSPEVLALSQALRAENYHPLGIIPYREELTEPRVMDLAAQLDADVIHQGDWTRRRVRKMSLCAATVSYACQTFEPGTLVITPGDREDIMVAACLASIDGIHLAGLLLTGGRRPSDRVVELCQRALDGGLPILSVPDNSYETAAWVHGMSLKVPGDDGARAELVMDAVASHLDANWLRELAKTAREPRMTTPAFRHRLIEKARRANRRIVLPEGDEPRTITAAAICAERGIARCVLLGERDAISRAAKGQGVRLPDGVEIIEPESIAEDYVAPMMELRKHKGLTEGAARDALQDTVVLGTMMLKQGTVDGLVSGAVHTTANTIRPALQLIKTAPDSSLVSSVFFMCLPEQVLVYGDCAVNPNPTAEQLAEIALQCADSAAAFSTEPRVAMISYSTGGSGGGSDVDKVVQATAIAKERRPELLIDGPLQYDAAAIEEVGRKKAPDSPVAGRATVFVFPDLNTGNTTYKAVQRSAHVVSMGPMLQGLAKPVNDLSRGALVEDIVFTIALTAIQASAMT